MDGPSDEELVAALAQGEAAALRTLMQRYQGPLFGYLSRMVGSRDDAEDLFQEVFVRVLRHAHRFEERRRFRPWVYAIASNLVKNTYRWRSYRGAVALDREDEDGQSLAALLAGREDGPAAPAERAETADAVRAAVEDLPPKGREALVLFYYQGLSYEEVAEALEIPLGTVKSRIHNAMKRLSTALEERRGSL
ncbi:MAG: RNA polymerase sigma factor [Planctomycetota bacterium]